MTTARTARPLEPVAIVGLGVSGRAVARHLLALGVRPTAFDSRPLAPGAPLSADLAALAAAGLELRLGEAELGRLPVFATAFVTPGMRKDHPALMAAAGAGTRLTGEIPFVLASAEAPVIGITGSAGKTTTTTLVGESLHAAGLDRVVGGNIGRPASEALGLAVPPPWLVLELSSFQLDLSRLSPRLGALLNLAPNHLDVHRDMDDYRRAKLNVLAHQGARDIAVTAADHPVEGAERAGRAQARPRFGVGPELGGQPVGEGTTVAAGWLVCRMGGREERLVRREEVRLPGRHNLENVLAACLIARLAGAPAEAVGEAVRRFRGVAHRLELVHEAAGVRYVDDSIATAPDRTIAALEATEGGIVLIAGGSDKGVSYDVLGPVLRARVRLLLTMGPTGPLIAAASRRAGGPEARACADLAEAVAQARALARPGETVLLAPASASFDQFPNYAARGDAFRRLARGEPGGVGGAGGRA